MKTLLKKLAELNPIPAALGLYFLAMLGDWGSSLANNSNSGTFETNPFVRNEAMKFVLSKGMAADGIYLVALSLCAYLIYSCAKNYSKQLGRLLASVPFGLLALDRIFNAVIPNILLYIKFLHP